LKYLLRAFENVKKKEQTVDVYISISYVLKKSFHRLTFSLTRVKKWCLKNVFNKTFLCLFRKNIIFPLNMVCTHITSTCTRFFLFRIVLIKTLKYFSLCSRSTCSMFKSGFAMVRRTL
jgi:hypothetical protein